MLASIRTKVLFLFFMGMTLVVTALVSFTLIEVREHYTDLFHQRGEIAAQELAGKAEHLIELGLHPNEFLGFDEQCRKIVAETPAINYAALVDRGGKILYQSSDSKPTHRLTTQPDKKLAIKHPLKFASLNLGSYIYITLDKVAVDAQVDELLNKIVIMGIVLATIGTFVMMVFMRLNFIAPVNLLLQHIESMSLDRKPDLPSELANRNDELGTISSAFDHLADKVTTSQFDLKNHAFMLEKTVKERTRELSIANEELNELAHTDSLTGLPNRLYFMNMLQQGVAQAKRYNHTLAVFLLDLNGFKDINDQYGHAVGDHTLKTIAGRVRDNLREGDTFSRLGGDEFALLIAEFSGDTNLQQIAEKITDLILEPIAWHETQLSLSASIGIAILDPSSENDADELLRVADTAMYAAKKLCMPYKFSIKFSNQTQPA